MDLELRQRLVKAICDKDAEFVRGFCEEHSVSAYRDEEKKNRLWLEMAIRRGDSRIVRVLLDQGLEANPQLGDGDQTPLTYALDEDKDDVVVLLLERGADPNAARHTLSAVSTKKTPEKQLLYLRLLLDYGAEINRLFQLYDSDKYFTVLDWATDPSVKAFLVEKGGMTAEELAAGVELSPDSSRSLKDSDAVSGRLQEVFDFFTSEFGEVAEKSFSDTLALGAGVTIRVIPPKIKGEPITLFSLGLSARPMNVPAGTEQEAGYAELYLQLPSDWQLDDDSPCWSWPIRLILDMANYPLSNDVCYFPPVTCVQNGEPPRPLGPDIPFTSTAMLALKTFTRSDGNVVNCYCLIPIHADEHEMVKNHGEPAFLKALDDHKVSRIIDPKRESVT